MMSFQELKLRQEEEQKKEEERRREQERLDYELALRLAEADNESLLGPEELNRSTSISGSGASNENAATLQRSAAVMQVC